jgi:hypothetical protein
MTQITAKIIAHSITEDGKEIITWELELLATMLRFD